MNESKACSIQNLDPAIDEATLKEILKEHVNIVSLKIPDHNWKDKKQAFVNFSTSKDLEAIEILQNKKIGKFNIKIVLKETIKTTKQEPITSASLKKLGEEKKLGSEENSKKNDTLSVSSVDSLSEAGSDLSFDSVSEIDDVMEQEHDLSNQRSVSHHFGFYFGGDFIQLAKKVNKSNKGVKVQVENDSLNKYKININIQSEDKTLLKETYEQFKRMEIFHQKYKLNSKENEYVAQNFNSLRNEFQKLGKIFIIHAKKSKQMIIQSLSQDLLEKGDLIALRIIEENKIEKKSNSMDLINPFVTNHNKRIEEIKEKIRILSLDIKKSKKKGIDTILEIEANQDSLKELQLQFNEFHSHVKKLENGKSDSLKSIQKETKKLENHLPIYAYRTKILEMVKNHQIILIIADTGSGKSTQCAQYLSEAGYANNGKRIICTQPRGVAARTLAHRVSEEQMSSIGNEVGYHVSGEKKFRNNSKIVFMTDRTFLNDLIRDVTIPDVSCVIIDEAHERSVDTDLILGYIQKAMDKRKDLRVIVTSATLDQELFSKYFNNCPTIKVPGRVFPVQTIYHEKPENENDLVNECVNLALSICEENKKNKQGDILVFLTSQEDIDAAIQKIQK
jgi:hypothetical protein